jgi:hypothetical protein
MATLFARELESAAEIYRQAIGNTRSDIDVDYIAFLLRNLFMMLQFSYSCAYHTERLKILQAKTSSPAITSR